MIFGTRTLRLVSLRSFITIDSHHLEYFQLVHTCLEEGSDSTPCKDWLSFELAHDILVSGLVWGFWVWGPGLDNWDSSLKK